MVLRRLESKLGSDVNNNSIKTVYCHPETLPGVVVIPCV